MNFSYWKAKLSGWSVVEGFSSAVVGSDMTVCQVIVMIDPSSHVFVVREARFQHTDAEMPRVTTWSLVDFIDVDGDGQPDVVLRGENYENVWLEVHSASHTKARMIFSGLGYYL